MKQSKEDMKSLLNDLANADKEISVRRNHQICFYFQYQRNSRLWFLMSVCLSVCPQSLKKKVEFLQRTLSTPTRTNEALSRLVFERCLTQPLDWNLHTLWLVFHENIHYVLFTNLLFLCPSFSPAPMELKQPRLHQPADSEDIDLNITYDISTPDDVAKRPTQVPSKKMRLDPPA